MSKRLPPIGFTLLALATVGAFFLIQALKTAPPLIWGDPSPTPAAINPVSGRKCTSRSGQELDYRQAQLTIAASRTGPVGVYVVSQKDAGGPVAATISSGTPMLKSKLGTSDWHPMTFTWNGRLADGTYAPDGVYYFRIELPNQGRNINLSNRPVTVITQPPHPRVLNVGLVTTGATSGGTASGTTTTATRTGTATTTTTSGGGGTTTSTVTAAGPPVLAPTHGTVTSHVRITFTRGSYRRVTIDIYRTDVAGKPRLATTLHLGIRHLHSNSVLWNGKIGRRPAPAGTYLVGITAQDQACNQATWPIVLPPAPGTTPHAGVTIRYLSVTPPLTPTVSGSRPTVAIDSPNASYVWQMHRSGTRKVLAHGSGPAGTSKIHPLMPRHRAGLYTLTVRAGTQRATVPLVAQQAGAAAAHDRVLIVLPMLTWIGNSPVDDTGDGLPDTLQHADAVSLDRPLVSGPPASLAEDATLLNYLDSMHVKYQLTTDVALAEGHGPSLVDRWGVLFPGGEEFLPGALASGPDSLAGFVKAGGRVAVLGAGSLRGVSDITGFPSDPRASAPVFSSVDPFGARRGSLTSTHGELITELTDALNLFNGATAFSGFSDYQPIQPPSGATISAAGIASGSPAIIGFRSGSGIVIAVGLPGFGASLAHNVDSQELLTNIWHVLAKER